MGKSSVPHLDLTPPLAVPSFLSLPLRGFLRYMCPEPLCMLPSEVSCDPWKGNKMVGEGYWKVSSEKQAKVPLPFKLQVLPTHSRSCPQEGLGFRGGGAQAVSGRIATPCYVSGILPAPHSCIQRDLHDYLPHCIS